MWVTLLFHNSSRGRSWQDRMVGYTVKNKTLVEHQPLNGKHHFSVAEDFLWLKKISVEFSILFQKCFQHLIIKNIKSFNGYVGLQGTVHFRWGYDNTVLKFNSWRIRISRIQMMQLHISYHLLKEPEYLQMSKLFREWLQQPQPSIAPILSNWVTLDKGEPPKKSTYYGTLSHKAEFELRPKRTNHFTKEIHLENSRH